MFCVKKNDNKLLSLVIILYIRYNPSKLVVPEFIYKKLNPNNIIQLDNPPNKK